METSQNVRDSVIITDQSTKNRAEDKKLPEAQNRYISYKAVAGLTVEVGGKARKISKQEFADLIGYNVRTLLRWEAHIPEFWKRVQERRQAICGRDMTANVWSRVYLDAMAGKIEQQKMWLGQFDSWKPPAQAHDIKLTSWADVINKARQRKLETENQQTGTIISVE